MVRLVTGIAEAHGLRAECSFGIGYPVTVNDAAEAAFAGEVVPEVVGADRYLTMPRPATGSEDFSFVLDEVPGAFLVLGAHAKGPTRRPVRPTTPRDRVRRLGDGRRVTRAGRPRGAASAQDLMKFRP